MKSTRMLVLWLVAAAWLVTGVNVHAQSNADAVLSIDFVGSGEANGTDDGVTGGVVAGAGTQVVLEIFANPIATGITGANISFAFDQSLIRVDTSSQPVANLDTPFGVVLPATDSTIALGSLTGPVTPTGGFLGRITLVTQADVTGTELEIGVTANIAVSTTDNRDVVGSITLNSVPKVTADASTVEIPSGGVSPAITLTASGFEAGASISFVDTKTGGSATPSLTDNGDGTATITASGIGFATVDVTATDGTNTTAAVSLTFSEQVPAELAAFGGSVMDEGVSLNWTTTSQTNNAGWQVMRSSDGITYEVVSDLLPGAGTSDAVLNYGFEDTAIPAVEKVFYRLDQIDLDGSVHSSAPIEVILGARFLNLPTEFGTHVYPNPFNPATTIAYDLPSDSAVSIVIYDALGQEVRRLISEQKSAGRYTIQWDAMDNLGRGVSSGVYIAKVEAGQFSASQKMLLLK